VTADIIDGYCHCGQRKYRSIEDVRRVMDRFGVSRAVLVQHLGEYDNSYLQHIVVAEPDRFAGVFLVNVEDAASQDHLACWAETKVFRGIRLVAHTLRSHPSLWDQVAEIGLNIVVYEEPILAPYADLLDGFANRHPNTLLILSHLGMPDPNETPWFQSHRPIFSLGRQPNVFVQISGFHMFGKAPYAGLVPLIERLVEDFGPNRLFFGSNYPVMKEEATFGEELRLLRSGMLGIPQEAANVTLAKTAMKLWFDVTENK
jgi:L-fuconolactonase